MREILLRRVILVVNTTLDGYMAGPNGELDWMVPDAEMNIEAWHDLRGCVDTILAGRKTYQGFESHFRHQANDPDSPPMLVEFARWMVDTHKVIFSRSLSPFQVHNGRVAAADLPREVTTLKHQPGGDMVLFGGVSTVHAFIEHGLLDEYWFKVHPVAIGEGRPVFPNLRDRLHLQLTGSKTYESGVVVLRYRPV